MSKKKTQQEFENEVYEKTNGEYIVIDKYINNRTKIWFYHVKCGEYKFVQPNHVLTGQGCKKCGCKNFSEGRIKTQKIFEDNVFSVWGNEYSVMSNYHGDKSPISIKHNICGHVWTTTPNPFLKKHGCPCCMNGKSRGEKRISEYLDSNSIIYNPQQKYDGLLGVGGGQLSYDFYIDKFNILIEYQGEYHDGTARNQSIEDYKVQKEHDKRKRDYALLHNIKLLEIWYWDYENIEEILKSRLLKQSA